jgi:hypothetical protein
MPIKKQYLKSKPVVKVTFEVSKEDARYAKRILLLSEHNGWEAIELKKFKNGKFKAVADIPTTEQDNYQFIYKAIAEDGGEYAIKPDGADEYTDNGMTDGGKNAVIFVVQ